MLDEPEGFGRRLVWDSMPSVKPDWGGWTYNLCLNMFLQEDFSVVLDGIVE